MAPKLFIVTYNLCRKWRHQAANMKQPINNVVTDRTNMDWPMIKTDEQIDRQDLCTQLMDSIDMKAFIQCWRRDIIRVKLN